MAAAWIAGPLLLLASVSVAHAQRPAEDESVPRYLGRTIVWYRDVAAAEETFASSRERLFTTTSARVPCSASLRLSVRARGVAVPATKAQGSAAPDDSRSRNLMQAEAAADQRAEKVRKAPGASAAPAAPQNFRPDSSGIVGMSTELFSISQRMKRLNRLMRGADELLKTNDSLRGPL